MYIYNSLTKKKNLLLNNNNNINIYLCGATVYDKCHIGHARIFIIFDILIRYLKYMKYNITYVRNITDIDDKIIYKSNALNIKYYELANHIIAENNYDFNKLNILKPKYEPKVTDHIQDIIDNIKILINKKKAYLDVNNNILFDINSFKNYGILSNRKNDFHKNFILWKNYKNIKKNMYDYNWLSPWGIGRPGWHIECTTINNIFFKNKIDIHGGGIDLIFPHHENELAQSYCINGFYNVNIWMHVGQVNIFNQKMSKSKSNFIYISNLYKYFSYESIRYYLSNKYYKKPINFSFKNLRKSKKIIDIIYKEFNYHNIYKALDDFYNLNFKNSFISYMNDDMNLTKTYLLIQNMFNEYKKYIIYKNNKMSIYILYDIFKIMDIIGLININNIKNIYINQNIKEKITVNKIYYLINKRNIAKNNKNWNLSDEIRDELKKYGILLEDTKEGTKWFYI